MSQKVQILRSLVEQRLTAAAEEIFGLFERTIAEYEEELCRTKEENQRREQLKAVLFHTTDIPQIWGDKTQVPKNEQQELSSSLNQDQNQDQENPEPLRIKEEQVELWTGQDGEQLQDLMQPRPGSEEPSCETVSKERVPPEQQDWIPSLDQVQEDPDPTHIKDELGEPWTHEEGEASGGSETDGDSDPDRHLEPDSDDQTENSSDTEDYDEDWTQLNKKTKPPVSGSTEQMDTEEFAVESSLPETGRDGTVWTPIEPGEGTERNTQVPNFLTETAGPTPHAWTNIHSKLSAFLCLCDEGMLEHIRECTVAEARRSSAQRASWDVSPAELKAFIALLYMRGANCGKNINMESFWSEHWGNTFFMSTLPRNRFREIMRFLQFDKKETRTIRQKSDKFALMTDVWQRFTQNCVMCYNPGPDITVDEQLFPTKARCQFTHYVLNKPDKQGIRFWMAADTNSRYLLNGAPHLGKTEGPLSTQSFGETVVLQLVEPFVGKGRSITTNQMFTSVRLANTLLSKNTSLVGPVRPNRLELPPSVQRRTELFRTRLLKHGSITLTVYQCRQRKNITILSSQHQQVSICTDRRWRPETVSYYNRTKGGVDLLDQMARQ
uniref:PiggyBac transposable element-derived protein domain-containing protein n=2 Tax=Sphaeramia orbicularis TaxID=375764 RepID=A0A672ZDD4_9TELE